MTGPNRQWRRGHYEPGGGEPSTGASVSKWSMGRERETPDQIPRPAMTVRGRLSAGSNFPRAGRRLRLGVTPDIARAFFQEGVAAAGRRGFAAFGSNLPKIPYVLWGSVER